MSASTSGRAPAGEPLPASSPSSGRHRRWIGAWWVDPAANELGRDAETVRIEPKAMQVLMVLADHAGDVVRRDDLLARVWPGVVVGDEALTQTIIKLRRALGDNPRAPDYIETISKGGYRLIAPVRSADGVTSNGGAVDNPVRSDPAIAIGAAPRSVWHRLRWPALAAGFVILAAIAWFAATHTPAPTDAQASESWDGPTPRPLTISVLPFESVGSGDHTYLARGIANDLMGSLSRDANLRLIRAPSDGASATPGRGARYVVDGSVQRDGALLRIHIHVVDTTTGQQLWSERIERPFGDLFATQDEIVRRLAAALPQQLNDAARRELAKRYTTSLDAYDNFLRAQSLFLVRQSEGNEEAREFYRKALAIDPKFARAYAGLAMTYAMEARLRATGDPAPALARAFELAETARLIDPDIPEVYFALGFVHVQSRRHDLALKNLHRAIELNPSFADAHAFVGGIHTYTGEASRAIPALRIALRLNPGGGYLYYVILGRAYLYDNDVEQALINLRQATARNPIDLEARVHLAAALAASGDVAAARWEAAEVSAIVPGFSTSGWLDTYPLVDPRYRQRLATLMAEAGLP